MGGADGAPRTADRAWMLAGELAALMDEAERAEIDLAARLPEAADPAYRRALGADLGVPAHRHPRLAGLAGRAGADEPGRAAGGAAGRPGRRLGAAAAGGSACWSPAPQAASRRWRGCCGWWPGCRPGAVVLPGLDTEMADEAWAELDDIASAGRPARVCCTDWVRRAAMSGRGRSLAAMHVRAADAGDMLHVRCCRRRRWPTWQYAAPAEIDGLSRLATGRPAGGSRRDRDGAARRVGHAGRARAALVTPDRELAGRVAAELLRYGVVADDSAGETAG